MMKCSSLKIMLLQGGIVFSFLLGGCGDTCKTCPEMSVQKLPAKTMRTQQVQQVQTEQRAQTMRAFETEKAKPDCLDTLETAIKAGDFSTLVTAIELTDLENTLRNEGPYTVFAPTDAAFSRLPEGVLQSYLEPENSDKLESLLAYHVVPGLYTEADLGRMEAVYDIQGRRLEISRCPQCLSVNDIRVLKTDIITCNGVIHVVEEVLKP